MKCHGLFLDSGLVFDVHVNSLVFKVNFILKKLYCLDIVLPKKIRIQLVHALIMPHFLYCIEIFGGSYGFVFRKLKLLFHRVMRYVFCVKRRDHISPSVKEFLGCSFECFVNLRSMLFFYKHFKLRTSSTLLDLFKFSRSVRNLQIVIPRLTPLLEKSFYVRIARIFNNLPPNLKTFNSSLKCYKRKLYAHFNIV